MRKLIQQKFSISVEQKRFLENYRKWGYSDRSSIVRDALHSFIKEMEAEKRRTLMQKKAQELSPDYKKGQLALFSKIAQEDDQ
jgi:metal-responsive CopG/Arc/MetJ family transcriptional regulator